MIVQSVTFAAAPETLFDLDMDAWRREQIGEE